MVPVVGHRICVRTKTAGQQVEEFHIRPASLDLKRREKTGRVQSRGLVPLEHLVPALVVWLPECLDLDQTAHRYPRVDWDFPGTSPGGDRRAPPLVDGAWLVAYLLLVSFPPGSCRGQRQAEVESLG